MPHVWIAIAVIALPFLPSSLTVALEATAARDRTPASAA
jgi:hypothetical protein